MDASRGLTEVALRRRVNAPTGQPTTLNAVADSGGRYVAKVSGRLQVVRILDQRTSHVSGRERMTFEAVNEATGRRITILSAQRLRRRVED